MPFLDYEPDLKGSPFTQDNLRFARAFLTGAIETHDRAWLRKPAGPLAVYWKQDGDESSCYLIELSRILSLLNERITKKSEKPFLGKFKQLLRPKNSDEFESVLTELQVACLLTDRARPIAFDPRVPEDLPRSQARPVSPDFGIRLPGSDVLIEVCVFRGPFLEWDQAVQELTVALERPLKRRKAKRIIDFESHLSFRFADLQKRKLKELVERIMAEDIGESTVMVGGNTLHVSWQPMPHISMEAKPFAAPLPSLPEGVDMATVGADQHSVLSAIGFRSRLSPDDYNEGILKSFRFLLRTLVTS